MFINSANGFYSTFGKGKTILFSDFDGTYMPFKHEDVIKGKYRIDRENFYNIFDNFRKYMTKKSDKFELNITSGRNLYEWKYFVDALEKMGLKAPLPQKMISSNGADVFIRANSNDYIHDKSSKKADEIKKLSGWNNNIRNDLMNILKEDGYIIIEPFINSNEKEYGKELTVQKFFPQDDKTKFAAFRKDDELLLSIIFSKTTTEIEFNNAKNKIQHYLNKKNIKTKIETDYAGKYSGGYPDLSIVPMISPNQKLTKLYDTKQKLNQAIRENDLVVVAGDENNDIEMLNPLNYLNIPQNIRKTNIDEIKNYFSTHLDKKEELRNLPLISIIVSDNAGSNRISLKPDFIKMINELAGAKKIIRVLKGELYKGLEEADREYAKINKTFKKNMKVKELILNHNHGTFMQIDDKLVIGPQLGKKIKDDVYHMSKEKDIKRDIKLLKPFEITDIIDLRKATIESMKAIRQEKQIAQKNEIVHHSIEFDAALSPTKDEVKRFFEIMKKAKGRVYLHCHLGQDRTSMFAAMYIAYTQGRTLGENEKYLYDFRSLFNKDGTSKKWKYLTNSLERTKFFSILEKLRQHGIKNNFDINKFDIDEIKI